MGRSRILVRRLEPLNRRRQTVLRAVPVKRCRMGRLELVSNAHHLLLNGSPMTPGPWAFDVLLGLVENSGRVLATDAAVSGGLGEYEVVCEDTRREFVWRLTGVGWHRTLSAVNVSAL
jgi:DNA-binding response OmpR family regulator